MSRNYSSECKSTGRQIDLAVVLERSLLVIEAKGASAAIRGGPNGFWEVRVATGGWKKISNHYEQALSASYALRDAMSQFVGTDVPYPSAALVFTPRVPAGSSLETDFKVTIVGLEEVETLFKETNNQQWTFDQWRAFAFHHNLVQVRNPQAAVDPTLNAAETLLDVYAAAFKRTYGPLVANMVPFDCRERGVLRRSDEIIGLGADGTDLLVSGSSGCGKTLIAYGIALDCFARGRIPLFISAKDFEGNFRDLVSREVVLLDALSAEALLSACRRLRRPLVFILDGYNECSDGLRAKLTRYVAVAARRYEATVAVTTQTALERAELLSLTEAAVLQPSNEIKQTIASQASGEAALNLSLDAMLNSVVSGLEARLIGEVSRTIPPDASRYSIFDHYVRKRLASEATEGISALSRLAGLLSERISFSLTVRDRDRFAEREESLLICYGTCKRRVCLLSAVVGRVLAMNCFSMRSPPRRSYGAQAMTPRKL